METNLAHKHKKRRAYAIKTIKRSKTHGRPCALWRKIALGQWHARAPPTEAFSRTRSSVPTIIMCSAGGLIAIVSAWYLHSSPLFFSQALGLFLKRNPKVASRTYTFPSFELTEGRLMGALLSLKLGGSHQWLYSRSWKFKHNNYWLSYSELFCAGTIALSLF